MQQLTAAQAGSEIIGVPCKADGTTLTSADHLLTTDFALQVEGGRIACDDDGSFVADDNGNVKWTYTTVDTNTPGRLTVVCLLTDYAMLPKEFIVGAITANVTQLGGDTQSATDLKDFADSGYDPARHQAMAAVPAGEPLTAVLAGTGTIGATSVAGVYRATWQLNDGQPVLMRTDAAFVLWFDTADDMWYLSASIGNKTNSFSNGSTDVLISPYATPTGTASGSLATSVTAEQAAAAATDAVTILRMFGVHVHAASGEASGSFDGEYIAAGWYQNRPYFTGVYGYTIWWDGLQWVFSEGAGLMNVVLGTNGSLIGLFNGYEIEGSGALSGLARESGGNLEDATESVKSLGGVCWVISGMGPTQMPYAGIYNGLPYFANSTGNYFIFATWSGSTMMWNSSATLGGTPEYTNAVLFGAWNSTYSVIPCGQSPANVDSATAATQSTAAAGSAATAQTAAAAALKSCVPRLTFAGDGTFTDSGTYPIAGDAVFYGTVYENAPVLWLFGGGAFVWYDGNNWWITKTVGDTSNGFKCLCSGGGVWAMVLASPSQWEAHGNTSGGVSGVTLTNDAGIAAAKVAAESVVAKLPVSGLIASDEQLDASQWAQTRFRFSIPEKIEQPETGTRTYTFGISTHASNGALADADKTPVVQAFYSDGSTAAAKLGAVTKVTGEGIVGLYTFTFEAASTDTRWVYIRFMGTAAVSTEPIGMEDYTNIVDDIADAPVAPTVVQIREEIDAHSTQLAAIRNVLATTPIRVRRLIDAGGEMHIAAGSDYPAGRALQFGVPSDFISLAGSTPVLDVSLIVGGVPEVRPIITVNGTIETGSLVINGVTFTTWLQFTLTAEQTALLTKWTHSAYAYRVRCVWTSPAQIIEVVSASPCTATW